MLILPHLASIEYYLLICCQFWSKKLIFHCFKVNLLITKEVGVFPPICVLSFACFLMLKFSTYCKAFLNWGISCISLNIHIKTILFNKLWQKPTLVYSILIKLYSFPSTQKVPLCPFSPRGSHCSDFSHNSFPRTS